MRLSEMLTEDRVETALRVTTKQAALDSLASLLARGALGLSQASIAKVLRDRETLASTGVGDEVAIPHGKIPGLARIVGAFALIPDGVDFDAIDGRPVRIVVALLAPEKSPADHLRALARVFKLLRESRVRERLVSSASPADVLRVIREEELPLTV